MLSLVYLIWGVVCVRVWGLLCVFAWVVYVAGMRVGIGIYMESVISNK